MALIIFNRPDRTARVLEAIASAKPRRLYVIADGPRPEHPEDERLVSEARAVIDRVDWPCELHTCYSDTNLRCGERIATGLDWLFHNEPEAIVLEDDCLPDPTFFTYCEQLLERYREDERVHMISGSTPVARRDTGSSYGFSQCYAIWGWASWARAWDHYDVRMRAWPALRDTSWLEDHLGERNAATLARAWFDRTYADPSEQWDFQWLFSGWLRNAVAVTPGVNLVSNIGFGADATHLHDADHPFAGVPTEPMEFPLRHPAAVAVDDRAERAMWDVMVKRFLGSRRTRLRRWAIRRCDRRGRGRRAVARARRALSRVPTTATRSDDNRASDRTVVIGSAVGLSQEQIEPFLASLRGCDFNGDVVLFVGRRLERGLRRQSLAPGIRVLHVRSVLPVGFRRVHKSRILWALWRAIHGASWAIVKLIAMLPVPAGARLAAQETVARAVCTPMEARFLHARRFLQRERYERVVLTDVRDVVFQRDPSADIRADALGVSLESRRYTIGSERLNRMWMSDAFGPEAVARLGDNPVSCVGVTYGGIGPMSRYLDLMSREILRLPGRAARRGGADTAIHNFLVWTNQLGPVEALETLASPVATLNGIQTDEVRLGPGGTLLNADGSEPGIVHQYDRVPGLAPGLLGAVTDGRARG